jgi:hypothetical protein
MRQCAVKISTISRVNGQIYSQIQCPIQVNRTKHSKLQGYTDPWEHQRLDKVLRKSKSPISTSHTHSEPKFQFR